MSKDKQQKDVGEAAAMYAKDDASPHRPATLGDISELRNHVREDIHGLRQNVRQDIRDLGTSLDKRMDRMEDRFGGEISEIRSNVSVIQSDISKMKGGVMAAVWAAGAVIGLPTSVWMLIQIADYFLRG